MAEQYKYLVVTNAECDFVLLYTEDQVKEYIAGMLSQGYGHAGVIEIYEIDKKLEWESQPVGKQAITILRR